MADRRDYEERLRARAFGGWDIKWLRNISISTIAGVVGPFMVAETVNLRQIMFSWAAAGSLFFFWELAMYVRRRYYLAPFAEHEQLTEDISALEARLQVAEHERADLSGQIKALKSEVEKKKRNQELADYLTERRAFAIRELLSKPPASVLTPVVDEWKKREQQFTTGVLDKMRAHGCTPQDIHEVEYLGTFKKLGLHSSPAIAKALDMLSERLNRIQKVSQKYAGD